jgi:hypothetical protein
MELDTDALLGRLQETIDPATVERERTRAQREQSIEQPIKQPSSQVVEQPPPEPQRIVVREVNLMARLPQDEHDALTRLLRDEGHTIQSFLVGAVRAYLEEALTRRAIQRRMPRRGER